MAVSKAEQAYQILKKRIMDGTYGPGRRLVMDQLGREYNISSIPWRESLRRLEAEGWVDFAPNVGAVVKTFDTESWQRSMRLLARLSGLATALAATRLTADDLDYARALNRDMAVALADLDAGGFGALNRRFHEFICSRCDDERLFSLITAEWSRQELIRRSAYWYAPGRALASLAEHSTILDLIEGGADFETIETVTRRHDITTLEVVTRYETDVLTAERGAPPPSAQLLG